MSADTSRPVHVVTDSTADIPLAMLEGQGITVVPLTVDLDGQSYRDGIDLTREEFLERLKGGTLPRTSQPSVGAFKSVFQGLLDQGNDVVAVHLASGLSGTFNSSRTAAAEFGEERVRVIDSGTVSMGFGWLALEASMMAQEGQSIAAIADFLERRKTDQRVYAVLETLEYLQKGGRIGRTAAFLGSALQIKPVVEVRDGEVQPLERVRTFRRALDRIVDLAREQAPWDHVAVLHLGAPEGAANLTARMQEVQPGLDVLTSTIGTVIGAYGGPGILGIAGLVSPRSGTG
jgi:DegV family protein with EDD domain